MSEEDLIAASKKGDKKALEALLKPYQQRVFSFLSKMCRENSSAEDLMQETMVNVFKKINAFQARSKFSTWLFQIAANNCLMLKRKNKKNIEVLDENEYVESDWEDNPADLYEKKEIKEKVHAGLKKLPELYRLPLVLKDLEGYSIQEVSDILKISVSNAKIRVMRARDMLKKILVIDPSTPPKG